ncbi:MAG: VIT1/CCC1 transporter family protein [Patescibacteria group bacterium]|jgi:VIT1/CCC1 family predicted Fe2+/Mn2+ transporter
MNEPIDQELSEFFEKKKKLLREKGNYSFKKLEEAFHQRTSGRYLGDVIFGANDGLVTTFAVVAGAAGAGLSATVMLVLGFANLVADGLSMGLGNYLGKKSEGDYSKGQRQKEAWEIEHLRPVEVAEVRGIFTKYGFKGTDLERAVDIVTADKKAWIDFMMLEELGIIEEGESAPARHGVATFFAFALSGFAPLIPFVLGLSVSQGLPWSIMLTAVAMFTSGAFRARITPRRWWRAGIEMLLIGTIAAGAAYVVGAILEPLLK